MAEVSGTLKDSNKKVLRPDSKSGKITHGVLLLQKIIFVLLLVVVFYPPYLQGLFFEKDQFPAEIFVFITFCLFWMYKYLRRDRLFLKTPIEYAAFGFVAVYFVSIFAAVGLRLAISEWLKYCMYFAVFFMLAELADTYRRKITVLSVIIASAIGVSLLGIDGAAGAQVAGIFNKIFTKLHIYVQFTDTFNGGRIFSTFQYPNTLAIYLVAVLLIVLAQIVSISQIWKKAVLGVCGFVLMATFILTLSRGAFIIFPVALLLYFVLLPGGKWKTTIVYILSFSIPAAAVAFLISGYSQNQAANLLRIWGVVLIGAAVTSVLVVMVYYIEKWIGNISWKLYMAVFAVLLVLSIVGCVIILNTSAPLDVSAADGKPVRKSFILKPGTEYKLAYEVAAKNSGYYITVSSRNTREILLERDNTILSYKGEPTSAKIAAQRELKFTVPAESRIINIDFVNGGKGEEAVFYKADLVDAPTGAVKNITLRYKYIPLSISSRFEDILATKSGVERGYFYKDGMKIMGDHWMFGAGGGAWTLLNFSYQSYMYWSTQVHNYFLQLAIECGSIGLLNFAFFIISILLIFISRYRYKNTAQVHEQVLQTALLMAVAALIMHSAIDFDFSLSALFLLLWELTALFNAGVRSDENGEIAQYQFGWLNTILDRLVGFRTLRAIKVPQIVAILAIAAVMILPIMFLSAKAYSDKAAKAMKNQ